MYIDSRRDIYFEMRRAARAAANHRDARYIKNDFLNYLDSTARSVLTFHGVDMSTGCRVVSRGEYVHRWTDSYRRRLLARFYKLDDWFAVNQSGTTLMTLTTRHVGFLPDQYALLQKYYRKLRDVMRRPDFLGKFTYFYVLEPHQDGYIHLHMLIFQELTIGQQERIKSLWVNKYGVGVADALSFEVRTVAGGVKSPKNYLMKYLTKSFTVSGDGVDTGSAFFLFSAVAWYMGRPVNDFKPIRFWNCSRDLQPILKLDELDSLTDIEWFKTVISGPDGDNVLWEKPVPVREWSDDDWL